MGMEHVICKTGGALHEVFTAILAAASLLGQARTMDPLQLEPVEMTAAASSCTT